MFVCFYQYGFVDYYYSPWIRIYYNLYFNSLVPVVHLDIVGFELLKSILCFYIFIPEMILLCKLHFCTIFIWVSYQHYTCFIKIIFKAFPYSSISLCQLGFSRATEPIRYRYIKKVIYYEESAHVNMEAEKSKDNQGELASWRSRRADSVIFV